MRTRKVLAGSPRAGSELGMGAQASSSAAQTQEWFLSNPLRGVGTVALACFLLLFVFSVSRELSRTFSGEIVEKTVMDSIAEESTAVKTSGGFERAEVLEENTKIAGFSDKYPTYELAEDASGESTERLSEAETVVLDKKVDKVVEQEVQEEAADGTLAQIKFLDQAQYDAAPFITVPPQKPMRQTLWWALKPYESYYTKYPLKWYIPRLDPAVKLTPELFHEHFRRHGRPVIISAEQSLGHLGFRTKAYTVAQLRELFPFNETKAFTVVKDYKANALRRSEEEIDLGPGLASIMRDEKLAKQGSLRNYPRNLHVKREALAKLEVDYPPLIPGGADTWQLPTLWLGTSTADTPLHHDCCDNFVLMIAGTKRMTLLPPTDWRALSPLCTGPNKSLCWAKVSDPNKEDMTRRSREIMESVHKIIINLKAGELLYMPAGWFHHIKNLGPTVMVNFWTQRSQIVGLVKVLKEAA